MDIEELILGLAKADGPNRFLDIAIALMVGYRREVETNQGGETTRAIWRHPVTNEIVRVPTFTQSIDDALKFVESVAPSQDLGFSWEEGKGSAKIGDGIYCQAVNPAIALCMAAALVKRREG